MFPRAFRVATIGGVDVRVDPSWFLIAVAIVFSYQRTFAADDRSLGFTIALAAIASLLFTASVLIHELAHALEGTHRGAEVGGITLFLLGGATAMHAADKRARDEFAIAAIGPWSNVVLAAVFGLIASGADQLGWDALGDLAGLMGWLNLGLALFNLVPGAPLDGGRVLRAGLWALTGNRHRATTAAAVFGIVFSVGLLGLAGWLIVSAPRGLTSGLWVGLIGAYMLHSARGELTRGRLSGWLSGFVATTLAPPLPSAAHDAAAHALLAVASPETRAWLVVDAAGEPIGAVGRAELEAATPDQTVGELARSLDEVPTLPVGATADELVNLLDHDQPFVLLAHADGGRWHLSSLDVIDRAISAERSRTDAPAAAEVPS